MVVMYPASAAATASRTADWNSGRLLMTWSAANEPMITPGLAPLQDGGGQADRGRRVARLRLEHDVRVGERRQLRLDGGAVRAAGDDHDALLAGERDQPVPGVAQQRLAGAGQVVQELGRVGARQRPQPRADAAGGAQLP